MDWVHPEQSTLGEVTVEHPSEKFFSSSGCKRFSGLASFRTGASACFSIFKGPPGHPALGHHWDALCYYDSDHTYVGLPNP